MYQADFAFGNARSGRRDCIRHDHNPCPDLYFLPPRRMSGLSHLESTTYVGIHAQSAFEADATPSDPFNFRLLPILSPLIHIYSMGEGHGTQGKTLFEGVLYSRLVFQAHTSLFGRFCCQFKRVAFRSCHHAYSNRAGGSYGLLETGVAQIRLVSSCRQALTHTISLEFPSLDCVLLPFSLTASQLHFRSHSHPYRRLYPSRLLRTRKSCVSGAWSTRTVFQADLVCSIRRLKMLTFVFTLDESSSFNDAPIC